ncbi:MAG: hypothetical protein KKB81_04345 [Candidatus Margulisbacteria bacterium]|nr:hypothetical protein [Candidatus Margulisiibacteriota bacterium]MBU1021976.1 hypothetical protein [Candidatus Margulisiibacteriota bacterium]MBU1728954.1 hypothetical protein [Candidatus Margulisiibacteriota bacterium]MBU1954760.1 hypothetical protein [Candidatus Margulisiibacteriota bacterium]
MPLDDDFEQGELIFGGGNDEEEAEKPEMPPAEVPLPEAELVPVERVEIIKKKENFARFIRRRRVRA